MARFESPEANSKLVAKNTLVLYFRMFAVMAIGLFTSRITLQALGVTDYGLQGVAGGVIGMLTFLNGSLSGASSRFLTVEMGKGSPGSLKRIFSTIMIVQLALAILFTVLLETIGLVVLESKLNIEVLRIYAVKWTYHCAVVSAFLGVAQVPYNAIIIAHERMSAFAFMAIYDVIAKLAIAFSLLYFSGDKLIILSIFLLINSIVTFLIYYYYCVRNFTEARFRYVFDRKVIAPIFSFAGWHVATQVVVMLLTQGVLLLNQRYFGPALIAAISIGQTLNAQIQSFIANFKTAANPQIIKLFVAGKLNESKRMLVETVHFSVFLFLLLSVPMFFYADEVLSIWLGANNVPRHAAAIAMITIAGAFFSLFDISLFVILYAVGRIKENAILNFIGGLFVFFLIFYQVKWLNNPLASVVTLAGYQVILGLINKPALLHFIAGYSMRDMIKIFMPSFKALVYCMLIGSLVKSFSPQGLIWAIPECVLIVMLNGLAIFTFVATEETQRFFLRLTLKLPLIGRWLSCFGEHYLTLIRSVTK